MMQIRAALAILLALFCIKYVVKKELLPYIIIMAIAVSIHYSILFIFPFFWFDRLKLTTVRVAYILAIAFIITLGTEPILREITVWSTGLLGKGSYSGGDEELSLGLGLSNPMIYYQIILTLLMFYKLDSMKQIPYASTIAKAYLYSTLILIMFSSFRVLSGRGSTIFATLEICIIPALIYSYNVPLKRFLAFVSAGVVLLFILHANLLKITDLVR